MDNKLRYLRNIARQDEFLLIPQLQGYTIFIELQMILIIS